MISLSNLPLGLMTLLGAKNLGSAPSELQEFIQATVDLSRLYLLNNQQVINGSIANINAIGGATPPATFVVPPGELWYVDNLSANALTLAGQTMSYAAMMSNLGGSQVMGEYVTSGPGESWKCRAANPFWATPGASLSIHVSRITGGPVVQTDLNIAVTKLRV